MDIRTPIGLMFTVFGVMMTIVGFLPINDTQKSMNININLWWGILMLVFGVFMLALAKMAAAKKK